MASSVNATIDFLIKRKIFKTEDDALRKLLREYILGQIASLRREVERFESDYGMSFEEFSDYLHDRSMLLEKNNLSADQRLSLSQAIMDDEDVWLDWKAAQEMLDNWLGINREAAA